MSIEIQSAVDGTPLIPSSTVMVVRDAAEEAGVEVLMMRRHVKSSVLGGVYVFPGGKVDAADVAWGASPEVKEAAGVCRQRLNEPDLADDVAWGFYAAALRETFEESGLVLGAPAELNVRAASLLRERMGEHTHFGAAIQALGWTNAPSALLPWSRWVTPRTPVMMSKRFDTRFFVAVAPQQQAVLHCEREVAEAAWFTPQQALEQVWAGKIEMAPPQIMSVAHLAHLGSVSSILRWARENKPPVIEPEMAGTEDQRVICYPGDPLHSVPDVPWPGPTRLFFRKGRFEAPGGLAALQGKPPLSARQVRYL